MLTTTQVKQLLAVAMAYDNRKPGEANIAAWAEASRRGRWTFEAALEAVHQHYAEHSEWLMPGTITQAIRAQSRYPERYELQAAALPVPATPDEARRAQVIADFAAAQARRKAVPPVYEHNNPAAPREPAKRPNPYATIDACSACDGGGMRLDRPGIVCTHPEEATA